MNRTALIKIFLFGCVLSLALQMPPYLRYVLSDGYDPSVLSDWDEAYYLPLPYDALRLTTLSSLFTWGSGTLKAYSDLDTTLPHALVDIVTGRVAHQFGITPPLLGILLDFLLLPLGLTIFSFFYSLLFRSTLLSLNAALVTLLFPWIAAVSSYSFFTPNISPFIQTISHHLYPSVPIFRGIYTQLSYPLFALFFVVFTKLLINKSHSWTLSALLGALGGSLLYIYFFAWGSALAVATFGFIFYGIIHKEHRHSSIKNFLTFTSSALLVSSIGLTALFTSSSLFTPGGNHISVDPLPFNNVFFLSPIAFALFICSLYFAHKKRSLIAVLVAAILISEHILMNSQALLNRWITPYHFPLFYLHPLLSGLTISILSLRFSHSLQKIIFAILLVCSLCTPWIDYIRSIEHRGDSTQLLLREIDSLPGTQLIASLPYEDGLNPHNERLDYLLLPYWIKVFTKHESFSQFMSFSPNRRALVEREIILGVIYKGYPSMIGWCPDNHDPVNADDLLQGAHSFHEHQRKIDCEIAREFQNFDRCELLNRFPISYYIDESLNLLPVNRCTLP